MSVDTILPILYDLVLLAGQGTESRPLIARMLQRLMYHTGFPAGFYFASGHDAAQGEIEVALEACICPGATPVASDGRIRLPATFLPSASVILTDAALLATLTGGQRRYEVGLVLPVPGDGVFILLSRRLPSSQLPLTSMFNPVLDHLGGILSLLRAAERRMADVAQERDTAQSGMRRFQAILDQAQDAIFVVDPVNGMFVDMNSAAVYDTGLARSDLLSMRPVDLIALPRSPSSDMTTSLLEEGVQAVVSGEKKVVHVETRLRRPSGAPLPVDVRISAVQEGDRTYAVVAFRDARERLLARERQEKLSTAIEHAGDSIMITDGDGVVEYVNPAFTQITGFTAEEVVGTRPTVMKGDLQKPEVYDTMWNALLAGKDWRGTLVNRKKSGEMVVLSTTVSPVPSESGETVHYVATQRDITRESHLERAREYFTAITSHELRTPLSKLQLIRLRLEGLRDHPDMKEEVETLLGLAHEVFEDLERTLASTSLTNALTKPLAQGVGAHIYPYPVVAAAVEKAEQACADQGRRVWIDFRAEEASIPVQVAAEDDLLLRAVESLISNAVKYSYDGGEVRVRISVIGERYRLEVADDGVGIEPEKLPYVFEPYFSPEGEMQYFSSDYGFKGGGLGLGLALARTIIERLGGSLTLTSDGPGKGATARLTLPIVYEPADAPVEQ